jgi:transcriptional regulator with XRE-family HTH domain
MMLIRITGSQLHAARVLVGLSREEVAERAGLCRHSIRKWETSSHAAPLGCHLTAWGVSAASQEADR